MGTGMKKNNNNTNVDIYQFSKIPPQARELEEAVIGSLLIDKNAYTQIIGILNPEMFYVDAHCTIFGAIRTMINNSEPVDLLTITDHLRKIAKLQEIGGVYYLSELTNKIASSDNIEFHARIIFQKWMARKMIQVGNDIIRDCYEDTTDVFDVRDNFVMQIDEISNAIQSGGVSTGLFLINKIKKNLLNPPDSPQHIEAILGIKHLYGTTDCYAAKPGTGKTEVLLESALISAVKGIPVGILSAELGGTLLMSKMLHHYTGVYASSIIENNVHGEYLERIVSKDYSVMQNIIIDDSTISNVNIRSKIIKLVKKHGCKSIWIDYLQLIDMVKQQGQTDVACMENMMKTLQRTAKELDICIIGLSQLKRGTEKPTMEDIRGGGIEAACSKIYLMEDPNMKDNYGKSWNEIDCLNKGLIEIINVKERFGDKGKIMAYYDKPRQRIMHWNDRDNDSIMAEMVEQPAKQTFDIF
jgi:replicative DNA helicase